MRDWWWLVGVALFMLLFWYVVANHYSCYFTPACSLGGMWGR